MSVSTDGFLVAVHRGKVEGVVEHLREIARGANPDPSEVAARLLAPAVEKFDAYLTEELRRREMQVRGLEVAGAHRAICDVVEGINRTRSR